MSQEWCRACKDNTLCPAHYIETLGDYRSIQKFVNSRVMWGVTTKAFPDGRRLTASYNKSNANCTCVGQGGDFKLEAVNNESTKKSGLYELLVYLIQGVSNLLRVSKSATASTSPTLVKTAIGKVTIDRPPSQDNVWGPQNPCYRCGGGCCYDNRIPLSLGEEFGALSQYVINPENPLEVNDFAYHLPDFPDGVYYLAGRRKTYISIKGSCPLLQDDGSCGDHANRPRGCRDTKVDQSIICLKRRTIK